MIYSLFRKVFSFALGEYFEKIELRGSPCEEGALLVVSNHPNDLLDPVLIASSYKRRLSFLAKSTIFKGAAFKLLLRSLSMIPLYRKQDAASEMGRNEDSFRAVTKALWEGRAILIFPEGTSANERKMAPLKTGAARMALLAETEGKWNVGVKIQPVGITYSDFESFRSSVTLVFGEPIQVLEFKSAYEKDSAEASRMLTAKIEEEIEKITVEVSSVDHERLVDAIASLYRWAGRGESEYDLLSTIATNVEALAPKDPGRKEAIQKELSSFLEVAKIFPRFTWGRFSLALLAAPFSLLGAAIHYVPYRLTGTFAKKIKLFGVEIGSRKFLGGIIAFGIFYLTLAVGAIVLSRSIIFGFLATLGAILLGQIANRSFWGLSPLILQGAFSSLRSLSKSIKSRGDFLIAELEGIRVN